VRSSGILADMRDEITREDLQSLVIPLLDLCREAGAAICEHYEAPHAGDYESKDDDSPLTRADLASDAVLHAGLSALDDTIPILSEESAPTDRATRRSWRRYWLVDPLDGTREFLARTGEFTINIALIDDHKPILGLLYRPLENLADVGIPGLLARRYRLCGDSTWSAEDLETSKLQAGQSLLVLASRRHRGGRLQACLDWLGLNWGDISRANSGSALKFSQMAAGEGDFYPRFSPCCEWDTAAGQAVLEASGGKLLGMDGEPLRYNCQDSLYSPHFYAIADADHPLWQQLLRDGLKSA
jgi:3'(2'), 5'-bisphosphate nucleotidase